MSLISAIKNWWAPSDGQPYKMSQQDIDKYLLAKTYFDSLKLPDVVTGSENQAVIYVNFDGTGNNKYVLPGESSNIGLIDAVLEEKKMTNLYEIGIGTVGEYKEWQQAWAMGANSRVASAVLRIATYVNSLPAGVTPYIITTGFSRGAAEARLLMQVIDDYGIPGVASANNALTTESLVYDSGSSLYSAGTVRMSALLYDSLTTPRPSGRGFFPR